MTSQVIICDECGFIGPLGRKKKRGSGIVERILWVVFFFPGIFYSLWRRSGGGPGCPKCGSKALTPFETPEGEAIMRQQVANRSKGTKA